MSLLFRRAWLAVNWFRVGGVAFVLQVASKISRACIQAIPGSLAIEKTLLQVCSGGTLRDFTLVRIIQLWLGAVDKFHHACPGGRRRYGR